MHSLHVWRARLDTAGWPGVEGLPAEERDRAGAMLRPEAGRRWIASRWALRGVLGRYLGEDPERIELRYGERGKPLLADSATPLRFNLSHSGELALIAVAKGREVGVDLQRIGSRRPPGFYAKWTRREAVAKCHGTGLGAPLPDISVSTTTLDAGSGFSASLAVAGERVPGLLWFDAEPDGVLQ